VLVSNVVLDDYDGTDATLLRAYDGAQVGVKYISSFDCHIFSPFFSALLFFSKNKAFMQWRKIILATLKFSFSAYFSRFFSKNQEESQYFKTINFFLTFYTICSIIY
jgi:hypothetical protein